MVSRLDDEPYQTYGSEFGPEWRRCLVQGRHRGTSNQRFPSRPLSTTISSPPRAGAQTRSIVYPVYPSFQCNQAYFSIYTYGLSRSFQLVQRQSTLDTIWQSLLVDQILRGRSYTFRQVYGLFKRRAAISAAIVLGSSGRLCYRLFRHFCRRLLLLERKLVDWATL